VRIAILGPSHPWRGGIAHHTASLYRALRGAGHHVGVHNFRRLYPEIFFPGRTQIDRSRRAFAVPAERIFDPIDPRTWLALGRRLMAERPDRLVLQWWHPFFAPGYAAVAAAARLCGCEVVMMCHNVEPHESTPLDRALLHLAYALPTRFIVQSEAEARRLEALLPRRARIDAVAHPRYDIFAPETDAPVASTLEPEAEHSLLFFGLVRRYKGLNLLLDAVAMLPEDLDFELRVVGEIYEGADDYRRRIARLGLGQKVRLDDRYVPNEEVPQIFAAADICVLPYRHATGSGVANVALACGTRLVMSRLATLEEAFADEPVRWFEPGDPRSLCDAIVAALSDPEPAARPRTQAARKDNGWRELVDVITRIS
jgi:glycosyltransferase involved in cell wall biosynthesis